MKHSHQLTSMFQQVDSDSTIASPRSSACIICVDLMHLRRRNNGKKLFIVRDNDAD